MSKTIDNVLLVPGESGWEIWSSSGEGGFALQNATEITDAGELKDIPSGELTMLFPVKSLTAVPMRVASDDDALFPDLAALHAERLGLRPDPMAGQLTDVFVIEREAENTALMAVFLRTPTDEDLPPRGPKGFDVSLRAFPVTGNTLAIWKEFGRWVFGVFHEGKPVYCQTTASDGFHPDEALAREIRLALIQLAMQGLSVEPSRILVWTGKENVNPDALRAVFTAPVEVSARPAPVPPAPLSKLLPADVRAARKAAQQKRNVILIASAAALVYFGLIGWFVYGVWQTNSQARKLTTQAEEIAPDADEYSSHVAKWEELSDVIQLQNNPVDILKRVADCIPPNSGLRIKSAEISATEIKLQGEAQQLPAVNTFNLKLTKNNELANFKWETPPPSSSQRGWDFVFTGAVPTEETQP